MVDETDERVEVSMRISSQLHFLYSNIYSKPWVTCFNFSVTDSLTEELAYKYHNHVLFCASRHDPAWQGVDTYISISSNRLSDKFL
jgi:hypothetical protein